MALITCPECGKDVSDSAAACIHCGYTLVQNQAPGGEQQPVSQYAQQPNNPQASYTQPQYPQQQYSHVANHTT